MMALLVFIDLLFRHYLVAPSVSKGYNSSSISEVIQCACTLKFNLDDQTVN